MKLKRREILLATVAASTVQAQPQDQLTEVAKRAIETNRAAINKVKLPMEVEPAFIFRA